MANHKLAVGVYARSLWWTYSKSLEVSESVEKVTFRNLGVEEIINCDSKKSYFGDIVHALPELRLLL